MNLLSDWQERNWKDLALCSSDKNGEAWMSYKKDDIIYAQLICQKCTVRPQCFLEGWENTDSDFYGIYGGVSEYEYLLGIWKEAKKDTDDNWHRTDRILQKFMRQIS